MTKLQLSQPAEFLRASHISRWGIVQTHVRQNIAEHMYRVWTLVRQWGPVIGLDPAHQLLAEEWALTHDLPEIRTGDAPTPHKTPELKAHLTQVEHQIYPDLEALEESLRDTAVGDFCKFCDTAEAILFLEVNGAGHHAHSVCQLLEVQMRSRLDSSSLTRDQQSLLSQLYIDARSHT